MARVFQYIRPVDAILTSVALGKTDPSENGIRIKEEPPDLDHDDLNDLLTDVNTTTQNVSTKSKHHHLNINENNERDLRPKSVCSNSSNVTRQKRKRNLNDSSESQDSQLAKKPRLFLHDTLPLQMDNDLMTIKRTCKICFVSFETKHSLNLHLKIYSTLLMCEICNSPFNSHRQLQRHVSSHFHTSPLFFRKRILCWFCQRTFCFMKRLQMHIFHCHKSLLEAEYPLKTDIDKILQNIKDCKIKRHSRISNSSISVTKNTDKIEKNTCREDTTVRVTRNSDKIRRNMETSMTRVINDVERNTPMENSTILATNSLDQMKKNKRVEDARVRIPTDAIKIEKDTWAEDSTISVTDDVEVLFHETRTTTIEDIFKIIGVVNNTEESASTEDNANRVINDTDKLEENERMENNMEAAVQPCSNNDAASVADFTNHDAEIIARTSDITNMVNVTSNVGEIKKSANCVTDSVTQNFDQVKQNTPVEGSANRVISDIVKIEPDTSIEDIMDSVINDVDKISQNTVMNASASSVTTKINKTQQDVSTVKSVGRTKEVVQEIRQRQKLASIKTPTKLNTSSPGKTKMRQTTLTEFLSSSSKSLREDGIKLEKFDTAEESFDVSVRNESRNLTFGRTSRPIPNPTVRDSATNTPTRNTPLLKMHTSPDSLIGLLNGQIKSEPVESFNSSIAQNAPYNLRKSSSRRSSVDSCDSTPSSVASRRSKSTNVAKRTRRTTMSLQEKWKNKYKCKECVVRLERCDYVSKRVLLKSGRSESIIPLQLKIGTAEGTTRNDKVMKRSNPRIRIVNFDNCIVVELLESV